MNAVLFLKAKPTALDAHTTTATATTDDIRFLNTHKRKKDLMGFIIHRRCFLVISAVCEPQGNREFYGGLDIFRKMLFSL